MAALPDWSLYRSFLAVLRGGSLSGAARGLKLTQPTVGRHIDELEASLGASLFTRAPDGLRPTAAALAIEPHAQSMAAAAEAALRAISGETERPRTVVRIAASEVVAAELLPPILASLRDRLPGLAVELSASDHSEDLLRRDADIAIRMARPAQSDLVIKRIGAARLGFYAHRSYVEKCGAPADVTQLDRHVLIGFDHETATVRALRRLGLTMQREDFVVRSDSTLVQLAAIRAGYGIGICQTAAAVRHAGLIEVLPDEFSPKLEVWIAMHRSFRKSAPMRAVFGHLAEELKAVYSA
jgi:DNA-binding transcriptional LysR family regulator